MEITLTTDSVQLSFIVLVPYKTKKKVSSSYINEMV